MEAFTMENKKTYEEPILTLYGDIEDITLGSGWGVNDFFVFGISNPIGNCGGNSCERSGS
jgi:hypothetical protein